METPAGLCKKWPVGFLPPSSVSSAPPPPPFLSFIYPPKNLTMLLYEDILTGDEMFSDAFPMYVLSLSDRSPRR